MSPLGTTAVYDRATHGLGDAEAVTVEQPMRGRSRSTYRDNVRAALSTVVMSGRGPASGSVPAAYEQAAYGATKSKMRRSPSA